MRRYEIGGYFELEENHGKDYYDEMYHFNLARTAIVSLLGALKCKKVLLPYYLCDSVILAIRAAECDIRFYNIARNFKPDSKTFVEEDEYILIVNYYGQLSNEDVIDLKDRFGRIILDNTHSYYQKPIQSVPTVYSCRKFFGLPDGAILSYDGVLPEMKKDRSFTRMSHILGRYEDDASSHYGEMLDTAKSFYYDQPMEMSRLTRNLLNGIDYDAIGVKRKNNYLRLAEKLDKHNKIRFHLHDVPMCYPFYMDDGPSARKELAKHRIYVPAYWGNVMDENPKESIEYDYAKNILPLPCDQRYSSEDMDAVIEEVMAIIGK